MLLCCECDLLWWFLCVLCCVYVCVARVPAPLRTSLRVSTGVCCALDLIRKHSSMRTNRVVTQSHILAQATREMCLCVCVLVDADAVGCCGRASWHHIQYIRTHDGIGMREEVGVYLRVFVVDVFCIACKHSASGSCVCVAVWPRCGFFAQPASREARQYN